MYMTNKMIYYFKFNNNHKFYKASKSIQNILYNFLYIIYTIYIIDIFISKKVFKHDELFLNSLNFTHVKNCQYALLTDTLKKWLRSYEKVAVLSLFLFLGKLCKTLVIDRLFDVFINGFKTKLGNECIHNIHHIHKK